MSLIPLSLDVLQSLEANLHAMTQAMVAGNPLKVAQFYADQALLTDLKEFRVEGRAAIDQHWTKLYPYKAWRLHVLESGGDADNPYQRLHSIARMEIKGQEYIEEGFCFVVWKKQANGEYRIHADIYYPLRFEAV